MKYELAEPSLLLHQIALVRKSLLQVQPIGGERGVRLRTSRPIRSRGGVNLNPSRPRQSELFSLHQLLLSLTPLFCWSYKSSLRRHLSSLTPPNLINRRRVYQLILSSCDFCCSDTTSLRRHLKTQCRKVRLRGGVKLPTSRTQIHVHQLIPHPPPN